MKKTLFAACLFSAFFAAAQPATDASFDLNFAQKIQAALQTTGQTNGFKNLSASVFVPGQGAWVGTFAASGLAALPTDARFGIASNSKSFVAGICLRLVDQGKLDLDAPISQYLPTLGAISAEVDGAITTRQLLMHQSGLFDFYNDATTATIDLFFADDDRIWQPAEILATIGAPIFQAGESFSYSNTNFLVAAMVCESIAQKPYAELLQTEIAVPLGLEKTVYAPPSGPIFQQPFAPLLNAQNVLQLDTAHANAFFTTIQAAGGIVSTAYDLMNWYRKGLFSTTFLSEKSQKLLRAVEPYSSYSLGLRARNGETAGGSFLHHAGAWGYRSYLLEDEETGIIVAVLSNLQGKSVAVVADKLFETARLEAPKPMLFFEKICEPEGHVCDEKAAFQFKNNSNQAISSGPGGMMILIDPETPGISSFNLFLSDILFSPPLASDESRCVELPDPTVMFGLPIGDLRKISVKKGFGFPNWLDLDFRPAPAFFKYQGNQPGLIFTSANFPENFDQPSGPDLPDGWLSMQPENVQDWRVSPFAGGALCKNNFNDGADGQRYFFELPMFSTQQISLLPILQFSWAYAPYPGFGEDSLLIETSTDCGQTWQKTWQKGGSELATSAATDQSFLPKTNEWNSATIELPSNQPQLLVRFGAINHFGNNIWLDDFYTAFVFATDEIEKAEAVLFYPNPVETTAVLELSEPFSDAHFRVFDVFGKTAFEQKRLSGERVFFEKRKLAAGAYFFELTEKGRTLASGKLILK